MVFKTFYIVEYRVLADNSLSGKEFWHEAFRFSLPLDPSKVQELKCFVPHKDVRVVKFKGTILDNDVIKVFLESSVMSNSKEI